MKYSHWGYYKSILGDLEVTSRYIEISPDNYGTYGTELARLFLSVGSEVDVVARLLCEGESYAREAGNIRDYREVLCAKFPELPETEVSLPKYVISLRPWADWAGGKTPKWWECYNKVKHRRDEHFREGNLENVLMATGGLCVLVSYLYYEDLSKLIGITPLFLFLDQKYRTGSVKALVRTEYVLPDFTEKDGEK